MVSRHRSGERAEGGDASVVFNITHLHRYATLGQNGFLS